MRKTTLLLIMSLFFLTINAQKFYNCGQRQSFRSETPTSAPTDGFSYCDRHSNPYRLGAGVGANTATRLMAFMRLPPLSSDHKLSWFSFYSLADDEHGAFVVLDGNFIVSYLMDVKITEGWNTVKLAKPLTLRGDNCLGYMVHSTKQMLRPLAFDLGVTIPTSSYVADMKSDDYLELGYAPEVADITNNNFGNLMSIAGIEGPDVEHMAAITDIDGSHYLSSGENTNIKVKIRNIGTKEITSLGLVATLENGERQNINATTNIPVANEIEVPVDFKAPKAGFDTYAAFRLPTINGYKQLLDQPMTPFFYNVMDETKFIPVKDVLIEQFVTEMSMNAAQRYPIFKAAIESLRKDSYNVSVIRHHAGYFKDFLTLEPSQELSEYLFNTIGGFSHGTTIDRLTLGQYRMKRLCDPFVMGDDFYDYAKKVLKREIQFGEITKVLFKGGNKIEIYGKIYKGVDPNDLYLNVVLTESDIEPEQQVNSTPDYRHDDAPRIFMTGAFGTQMTVNPDGTFVYSGGYGILPGNWDELKMKVVIFGTHHRDEFTDSYFRHRVLFSKTVDFGYDYEPTSSQTPELQKPVVTMIGNRLSIAGQYDECLVFDMNGRIVANMGNATLPQGLYVVKVKSFGHDYIYKVDVK